MPSRINFGVGNNGVGAGVGNDGWLTLKTFPMELMIFMATKWIQFINIFYRTQVNNFFHFSCFFRTKKTTSFEIAFSTMKNVVNPIHTGSLLNRNCRRRTDTQRNVSINRIDASQALPEKLWEQGRRLNPLFLIMSQTSYHILYPATKWSECPFDGNLTQEWAHASYNTSA